MAIPRFSLVYDDSEAIGCVAMNARRRTEPEVTAAKRESDPSPALSRQDVPALPPAINIEASSGTVVMMDGRLLHGTGVNHTDDWRYIMTQSNVKPWMRQQENWTLSARVPGYTFLACPRSGVLVPG